VPPYKIQAAWATRQPEFLSLAIIKNLRILLFRIRLNTLFKSCREMS